jgi:hypothetical protein
MMFGTSNIEHPTSNPPHQRGQLLLLRWVSTLEPVRWPWLHSMFSVGCWLFDVSLFPRPLILPDDFEDEG